MKRMSFNFTPERGASYSASDAVNSSPAIPVVGSVISGSDGKFALFI
jgi:hypothetical protein